MEKEIKVDVRMAQQSGMRGSHTVELRVQCETSGIEFLSIEMSLEDFGKLIGTASSLETKATVRGLDMLGKHRQHERRTVVAPDLGYGFGLYEKWLAENYQEPGWLVSTYLGSRNSTRSVPGGMELNFSVYRYVEINDVT